MSTNTKKKREEFGPLPEVGFIRLPHVLHLLGIAKTTLYNNIDKGDFPAPKKLTARTSVWSVKEIRAFINSVEQQ